MADEQKQSGGSVGVPEVGRPSDPSARSEHDRQSDTGQHVADDPSRAPEQEGSSPLPGDPRPTTETQRPPNQE